MPDFTNLDLSLVASFWIYFVGSFLIGVFVGVSIAKLFFHREKSIFEQEKKCYLKKEKQFEEVKAILTQTSKELDQLKSELSKNELYWNSKKNLDNKHPGNKALHDMLHNKNHYES